MKNNTPLRYPGGKSKITNFIKKVIHDNNILNGTYVEPFAGGAGVALNLLFDNVVDNIYINDKDRAIFAFWNSVLKHNKKFIERIQNTEITIDEWLSQREIQKNVKTAPTFDLGFSTFFLNRTNHSGIIKAGVIGGIEQKGDLTLDARFNKQALINKIEKIGLHKNSIQLSNLDAVNFLKKYNTIWDKKNTLIYLDPPYYIKGGQLYMNYFKHNDHVRIHKAISNIDFHWLVSYDNQEDIKGIYKNVKNITYSLKYSAGTKYNGSEIMFASRDLIFDLNINPLDI